MPVDGVAHVVRISLPRMRVQRWKTVKTDDGLGTKSVKDGVTVGDLVVEIDPFELARLVGPKAILSRKGFSILQGGAIKVKVLKRVTAPDGVGVDLGEEMTR